MPRSRNGKGLSALLDGKRLGSRLLRYWLPAALILPGLLLALRGFAEAHGWIGHSDVLLAALASALLVAILLRMAMRLNAQSAELHEAKELLDKIFDSAPALTAFLDRDLNFVKVNSAYAAADHKRPEDFVGKNHFALYPSAENEAIFRRVIETGQPYRAYARPFQYPDQSERGLTYWDWNLYPVFDDDGVVQGLVLGLTEVTERVRAEQQRLAAEAKFRELFNAISDAVFIYSPDGPFLEVNAAACLRLGYSREELLRLAPGQIGKPSEADLMDLRLRQLLEKRELVFETELVSKDGRLLPVEINARLVALDGQDYVLCVARDIWARKAIENALRENRDTTQALINATTESALLIDVDGTIRAINTVGAARFKHTPEQMVGRNVFDFMPPEVAASRRKMLEQVRYTRQPTHGQDVREGRHFELNLFPVLDDKGQVTRVAVYAKDITELHQNTVLDKLLYEIDQRVLRGASLETLLGYICQGLAQALDLPFVWIGRKEPGGQVALLAHAAGDPGYVEAMQKIGVRWDDSPEGRGPAGMAIRTGRAQLLRIDEIGFAPWREAAQRCGYAAVFALPLILRGEVYGMIALYANSVDVFANPHMRERLENLAGRINVALEMNQDEERTRLLSAALAAASNGVFITDVNGRIQWCNAAFCRLSGYTEAEVIGRTPAFLKSGRQDESYYRKLWETILAGESWSAETVEKHKDGSLFTVQQTITPIRDFQGEVRHFISIMEDITAQKATEEKIYRMAHYDILTDLPNRALFRERLHQALALARRGEHQVALLFLDLDRFKQINDSLGHHIGDLLLQGVAKRLTECVRETDTVARLAGDEFTVILQGIETVADAEVVAAKIVERLAEPFELDGQTVHTAVSIGIALAPLHTNDDETLIRLADDAMYAAKAAGRGRYRVHGQDAG